MNTSISLLRTKIRFIIISGVVLACVLALLLGSRSAKAFAGGDGTTESPYQISSCQQLQAMNQDLSAHYELAADIDCTDTVSWNEGAGFAPVGDCWGPGFAGSLDGKQHVIRNLTINRPTTDRQALFGCTNDGAIIQNLGMESVDITGMRYAGGIVGVLVGSTTYIRNSYVTGNVTLVLGEVGGSGQFAGGIVAGMEGGSHIEKSYSAADVVTFYHDAWGEGGISGYAYNSSIVTNSFWDTETFSTVLLTEGGGTGKTTVQMKTESTYTDAGWDFADTWQINEARNNGYPTFQTPVDADGVANELEDAAPNVGDGNDDGVADVLQPNVVSYINEVTGKYVTVTLDSQCIISSADAAAESALQVSDPSNSYAQGLLNFTANCGEEGYETAVQLIYHNVEAVDVVARKYNSTTHDFATIPGASISQNSLDSQPITIVTYHVTDGGSFDSDGLANGIIVDPVGLGTNVITAPNTGLGKVSQ